MRVAWVAAAIILGLAVGAGASDYFVRTLSLSPTYGPMGVAVLFAILFTMFAEPLRQGISRLNSDISAGVAAMSASEVLSGILGLVIGLLVTYLALAILVSTTVGANWLATRGLGLALTFLGGFLIVYMSVLTLVAVDPMSSVVKGSPRKGGRPKLLDTNVILDGRVEAVISSGFLAGPVLVPESVISEIHLLADSTAPERRRLGRRGLETLRRLLERVEGPVRVLEEGLDRNGTTDDHLVDLAQALSGVLVTNDFNLNKVGSLKGVEILNLNELAIAVRPKVVAGDEFPLPITRKGTERSQGVGHLPDGTMVVVEEAAERLGETLDVRVKSVLQTEAGQIIFCNLA